jgi:predicted acylesterase/phospholipase RssA
MLKRAICLAGGGPAAGLHIGALKALAEANDKEGNKITFGVWALSCIGAWVGIVYNQAKAGKEIEETTNFFRNVFRDDKSFKSFPMNTIFAPDWAGNAEAMLDFLLEPKNYRNAFLPREITKSFMESMSALRRMSGIRRKRGPEYDEFEISGAFSEGDFNRWTLNNVLAVNPAVRFLTALMYKSKINGLSRLYYPDSSFLKSIRFEELYRNDKPVIFHNAWNLTKNRLELFNNKPNTKAKPVKFKDGHEFQYEGYNLIDAASLCACSALPFIEQTVEIDGDTYCEGALVDTVNFGNLLTDNDVDEIWVSRIVDAKQIQAPKNLYDSMANLCELFAATVGEDDIELFKCRFEKEDGWKDKKIIEIPVGNIDFNWTHSNLERGIKHGEEAAKEAVKRYIAEVDKNKKHQIIGPSQAQIKDMLEKERKERAKERHATAD